MSKVTVVGGGSFGTAIAQVLARQGHSVGLWVRNPDHAQSMRDSGLNRRYLPDYPLHKGIDCITSDLPEALSQSTWVVVAVPSQATRQLLTAAAPHLPANAPIILGCKGIETGSLMTMDEVATNVLGSEVAPRLLALSGPSFAKEIMADHPTAVVLAARNVELAQDIASRFQSRTFRAYCSPDIIGAEMGGALKNVIAIAAGAVVGLGFGDNTRAALITRGLAEITRLACAKGANPLTLAGLAGLGDLLLTCTGKLSRNRTLGEALGRGQTKEEALAAMGQVAEGIATAASAKALAAQLGQEVTIIEAVYDVLHRNVPIKDALEQVVSRPPGHEFDGLPSPIVSTQPTAQPAASGGPS